MTSIASRFSLQQSRSEVRAHIFPTLTSLHSFIHHNIIIIKFLPVQFQPLNILVFPTGQSAGPGQDENGRHYVVPSDLFQNLLCDSPQGPGSHRHRGEISHTSGPAIPKSSVVPLFRTDAHHGIIVCLLSSNFVFFLFKNWYCTQYCLVSFVFGVFPYHSLFSAITRFGSMEPEMEIQPSSCHGCRSYSLKMVNYVKDFLYQWFL